MDHRQLIACCVEILDSYAGSYLSPEDHLNKYLSEHDLSEDDSTFISEVYSGLLRYSNVAGVVVDTFLNTQGKNVSNISRNQLNVLTYLGLFRLDEIGMPHFKRFVRSQDFNLMYKFFDFFVNESSLKSWIRDEWHKLYDVSFVQTTLLSPFLRWLPELEELVSELQKKVQARDSPARREKTLTKVKEFNLTKPRPRSVPLPQPIPKLQKHREVPATTYQQPKEFDALDEERVKNRRLAENTLMGSSKKQFSCANPTKSLKTEQKLEKIRQAEDSKLQFDSYRAKPLPKDIMIDWRRRMQADVPIKLNAAAIMREGKLFKEREQEVIKKLESLEAGAHDASMFLKWQSEMRQKDLEEELAIVARRRLEGKLSHEEAILSRQKLINDNQRKVDEIKQETQELMRRYVDERMKEEELMRSLVEDVFSGRENAKDAKKKLQQYKAKIVQEVNEESRELMRVALEEAEEEMKRKVELIHQIRAMEAAPIQRNKLVDFTETAGYRFLNEMSLAELRERLSLLKERRAEEEESKRTEILAGKQAKDEMLMDTLTKISKHRSADTKAKAEQRSNLKANREQRKAKLLQNDPGLAALQEKLEQRRAERLELQQKTTKVNSNSNRPTLAVADANQKKKSEMKRWSELEKSRKRISNLQSEGGTYRHESKETTSQRLTATDGSRLAISSRPYITA